MDTTIITMGCSAHGLHQDLTSRAANFERIV